MPTYEYRCPAGHDFEKFYRKISDAPSEVTCPDCGAIAERRLSAGAGLLFKGSGFYITDYGKDGKGARKESAAGSEAKSTESKSADSRSGDAKPSSGGGDSGASKPAETSKPSESKKSTGGSGGGTGSSSGGAA